MRPNDRASILLDWLVTLILSALAFGIYLTTMCRSTSFIDAGELAAVACVLGIAHPTGYPLFTITGHIAQWFAFGSNEVILLNGFSALAVALAVGVFFRVMLLLGRLAGMRQRSLLRSAAAVGSLAFAFSTTVWAQSVAVEVYGLHLLMMLLTMQQMVKSYAEESEGAVAIPRSLFAAAFLLGLSFTNHLTTLLLIPAAVTLIARQYGLGRDAFMRAVKVLPFFFLGLSLYLYLPIRAVAQPPVQWGYPATIERLLWHVGGKQYRNWMFSGFESAEKQFSYFIGHFSSEFNWLAIAVMLYGLYRLYRAERTLFWFAGAAFVGCVAYSINYDIHDIDSYFLLAYIACGVFIFFGTASLLEPVWKKPQPAVRAGAVALLLLLPILQVAGNRSLVDESDNYLTEDYFHTALSSVEPNALIISYQWDYFVSPSLYFQVVKKERPDVTVIDKELLRRSWYFIYLRDRFPWLIARSQGRVDAFLAELDKFEHDLPYDPRVIEERYVGMINDFVDQAAVRERPVYVGPEIEPEFGARYVRVPSGLMFRLAANADSVDVKRPDVRYRRASIETRLTQGIRGLASKMLTSTGALFLRKNRYSDARYCVENALLIDPTFLPAKSLLQNLPVSSDGQRQ